MKIHEYQAKVVLARYGVPVPSGDLLLNTTMMPTNATTASSTPMIRINLFVRFKVLVPPPGLDHHSSTAPEARDYTKGL